MIASSHSSESIIVPRTLLQAGTPGGLYNDVKFDNEVWSRLDVFCGAAEAGKAAAYVVTARKTAVMDRYCILQRCKMSTCLTLTMTDPRSVMHELPRSRPTTIYES